MVIKTGLLVFFLVVTSSGESEGASENPTSLMFVGEGEGYLSDVGVHVCV